MNWHPIETVKKDRTSVLLFTPDGIVEAVWCTVGEEWCVYVCDVSTDTGSVKLVSDPTHWAEVVNPSGF